MPQKPQDSTLYVSQILAGAGVTVTPDSGTGRVTIEVAGVESPTEIIGGANPFPIVGEAAASATSAGGAVSVSGAPGGATSGAGGAASVSGGAGTNGNATGGAASVSGGAGQGTGNGAGASVTGGASGGGATGNGGPATVTGGAAASTNGNGGTAAVTGGAGKGTGTGASASVVGGAGGTGAGGNGGPADVTGGAAGAGSNGNGGDVNLGGGAKDGTGVAGVIRNQSIVFNQQGAAVNHNTAVTLAVADLLAGIITSTPAAAINLQLPLATAMDTALPTSAAGDSFDFSVISLAGSTNLPTITTDTGWTLVGNMTFTAVAGNAGRFRAAKTGAGAWTLFRLA